ncbi:SGNH/GDSL hydrolase family protein [Solicola gregarius]|uniref:SGNH/GDSL hydrolase family protein n=1 Tax=Solicola gregarius TaxID=2908642 RepID=A0AA46YKY0_9ACTN|nr:SGNH/GDSL hydrolase family protein [Solicola gregarius]UYM05084.1 SGNH/GDSL hydrolase family protein [Solicola gregarius]
MRRRTFARVAAAAMLTATIATGPPSTAAPADELVALGDSYSSGTGTREYYDEGCQRSHFAYAEQIAQRLGATLDMQACSGATVATVSANQLGTLDAETDYVTLTVGGNDAGFVDVLLECAQPGWASDCDGAVDGAQAYIRDSLPGSLDGLYAQIASLAPNATVVVGSYPRLFMGEDCNAGTWFSPAEQERLNATADQLADTIAAQASAHGFGLADVRPAFVGHAVCDSPEWVNGLSNPVGESFHPNRDGQVGYADVFDGVL